ncbi:MAG TPA: biopolymer transporter ExbD, partial [Planctomycetota bacterium]|nr:biopolymer transporter ExbD [Planctomycetota bacterium]
MPRFKVPEVQEEVPCNLIPMIDIMFLLLLFFMLGADMGHRDLETVRLPNAENAKTDTQQEKDQRLTINANHKEQVTCSAYGHRQICRDD